MQIVENWSVVQGRVVNVAPASAVSGFSDVEIEILASNRVEGFPNMLQREVGRRIRVYVPESAAHTMSADQHVTLRVRRASANRVFAADES